MNRLVARAAIVWSSVALGLEGCKEDKRREGVPAAVAGPSKITIGATLPLTGEEGRIGGYFKEGYELAFEEASNKGGLNVGGRKVPVSLTLLDDASSRATAVSLADRLINNDRVDFLLGTYSTELVEAQSTVAEENKVPYVNGGGAASAIYERDYKYLFGLLAPVELLAKTLMAWIAEEQKAGQLPKPAKIALLWENTSDGKDFQKGMTDFVQKSGGAFDIAVDEPFERNAKDFSALLSKVKSGDSHLFLVDARLPDYVTLHRQYLGGRMCHLVVSYGASSSEKAAIEALGPDSVSYAVSAVWWNAQVAEKGRLAKKFVDAFQAKYGKPPEWFQALGYETARALFTAIEQAASVDRDAVRAKLAAMDIESLLPGGRLKFPANYGYQAQNSFLVQQNMPDGTAPIIFPREVATAEGVGANPKCGKK